MDNLVLLVVSRLSSYSSNTLSSTSRSNCSRKFGTLSDPVTTRSDKHACGKPMLTDHDKQATENREPANEMNKEDPTQGIPVWLQPFTVNLEDLEAQCSHIPLKERSQIRKMMLRKWRHKNGSTVFMLTSSKNQKRSVLRAEKYGDLTPAEHKVLNGGRESRNNHRYAVVVQVLATQRSVANQNFTGDGEECTKVLIAVAEAKSYSYVQFIRFGQVLWRISMESSNNDTSSIRDKRNCRMSCTSNRRRDISRIIAIWIGWWVVVGFFEMLLLSSKWPRPPRRQEISKKRRFGASFQDMLCSRPEFGKTIFCLLRQKLEKIDGSEIYPRRLNAKEVLTAKKNGEFVFPVADGSAKLSGRDYEFQEPTETGIHRKERESQQRISWW